MEGGPAAMGMMIPMVVMMLDNNSDGALEFNEVEAFHRRVFNALDANHDGKLTPDEIRHGLQALWGSESGGPAGDQ